MKYRPDYDSSRRVAEEPFASDKQMAAAILGAINLSFERRTSSKGLSYSRGRRVIDFDFDRSTYTLTASVKGSAGSPYRVELELPGDLSRVARNECSCPVKFDCKHAAAALWSFYASLQKDGVNPLFAGDDPQLRYDTGKVNHELRSGLEKIAALIKASTRSEDDGDPVTSAPQNRANQERSQVIYLLRGNMHGQLTIEAIKAFYKADGSLGRTRDLDIYSPFDTRIRTLDPQDSVIVRLLADAYLAEESRSMGGLPSDHNLAETIVDLILATERAYWLAPNGPRLKAGPDRPGQLIWQEGFDQRFRLAFGVVEATGGDSSSSRPTLKTFHGSRFYIDEEAGELGQLVFDPPLPEAVFNVIDNLTSASKDEMQAIRTLLDSSGMPTAIPRPQGTKETELRLIQPVPCLWLENVRLPKGELKIAVFSLNFPDGLNEKHPQRFFEEEATGKLIVEKLDPTFEMKARKILMDLGFSVIQNPHALNINGRGLCFHAADPTIWPRVFYKDIPDLIARGWEITAEKGFMSQIIVTAEDASDVDIEANVIASMWLGVEMGIIVDGRRVSLLPILKKAIKALGDEPKIEDVENACIDGKFLCPIENTTQILALPYQRVKHILAIILELYDSIPEDEIEKLAIAQAAGLNTKPGPIKCTGNGAQRLIKFNERLHDFDGLGDFETPEIFKAELRPYQKRGVGWLQFLSEFGLGGILADDMGLGKTVQTLAHICIEKETGRLQEPFLIVCPVTVFPNWLDEAERFAPTLKVLPHRGSDRAARFKKAGEYDIVLTTYSALTRDNGLLAMQKWQGVFLDEAQYIKNHKTRNHQAAVKLTANQKICLTGTPIENNLGELWSLMDFAMPGGLDTYAKFHDFFRKPIEKFNDPHKKQLLAQRISPFLIRRTKEAVAPELPAKTVIVHHTRLEGDQRDLYESVRAAMLEQVRDAIETKGLAKSQIIILTAMLRLRQVCCDPRIVGLAEAKKSKSSVKLDALMELVLPLVEEGRKILLFSQFTGMLDIIAGELKEYQIPFVEIRGSTADRRTPVKQFQEGNVPVFLISLKAGGTGLNLTAADTVIHYDPWWNPAVEDQATDRAHRIGQDKPVFVYKLLATETIEDRMQELQEFKRHLYQAILDGDKNATVAFTEEDIAKIFAPLPKDE